jgi:hypothetical protein
MQKPTRAPRNSCRHLSRADWHPAGIFLTDGSRGKHRAAQAILRPEFSRLRNLQVSCVLSEARVRFVVTNASKMLVRLTPGNPFLESDIGSQGGRS